MILLIINVSVLLVLLPVQTLEKRVHQEHVNVEQRQRVLDKHLDLFVILQIIFVSVLQPLHHVVEQLILVPVVYVNVAVQMRVVTQAKRVARGPANVALPLPVLVRHQVPSVMRRIMYVNALPPWHYALEHLTRVQVVFASAVLQMPVVTRVKLVARDLANVVQHQRVLGKQLDLTVMLQTTFVNVQQA